MEKKLKFTFSALISMQQHAMKSKTQKKILKKFTSCWFLFTHPFYGTLLDVKRFWSRTEHGLKLNTFTMLRF